MPTRTYTEKEIYGSDYDTETLTTMVVLQAPEHGFVNEYFYPTLGFREWDENDWVDFLNDELPDNFGHNTTNRDSVLNAENLW